MSFASRILALVLLGLSTALEAGAGIGVAAELKDPRGLLLSLAAADSCVVHLAKLKELPSRSESTPTPKPVSKASALFGATDESYSIDDAAAVRALVKPLSQLELKPSSYCFCYGQPTLRFYRQGTYLGSVRVKHDDNIELGDGTEASGYFSGRVNLVTEFYAVLSPLIKALRAANGAAAVAAEKELSLGELAQGQAVQLKAEAAGTVKAQEASVRDLPVPAIAVPVVDSGTRK